MKTPMSRFQIHDDLTAPRVPVQYARRVGVGRSGAARFLGVLAGSPGGAGAPMRGSVRSCGTAELIAATIDGIALGVAEYYRSEPGSRCTRGGSAAAGLARRRGRACASVQVQRRARGGAAGIPAGVADRRPPRDAPARGGARGRLGGRADPGGDRRCLARSVRDGQRRWGGSRRRLERGIASARGGVGRAGFGPVRPVPDKLPRR